MRVQIIGAEYSAGTSKANEPYSMGSIYVATRMENTKFDTAKRRGETKGAQGAEMRCDHDLAKRLCDTTHFPVEAELEVENVMRFGKPELKVANFALVKPLVRAAA
ncbi:MAG: hypothetical protein Q7T70_02395 [Polaromonas sp.]|nr:hypothetical protein [Polaromonas sp.]